MYEDHEDQDAVILGDKYRDTVTDFIGTATAVTYYATATTRVCLTLATGDTRWFDLDALADL
jgi:hypothetical protein